MAGYTRQEAANIVDAGTLQASHFNNEYNAIQAAFNASTGHNHDGTAGEGSPITQVGPAQDIIVSSSSVLPKATNTYSLGNTTYRYTSGWFTGTVTAAGFAGPLTGAVTGNASTASAWATARSITLAGDLTGSVNIDGSANVTITGAVVDDSHTHDGRYYTDSEVDTLLASTLLSAAPTGVVLPYTGTSAPTGWLFCGGQPVSRATYATLFSLISTTFGSGDGSTTFNVPDLRGRAVFGKDNMGSLGTAGRITNSVSGIVGTTLGASGGSEALHGHTHGVTDAGHTHTMYEYAGTSQAGLGANGIAGNTSTGSNTTGITIDSEGDGTSENMPPALILNYIIKH